jgi:hypothetical protein
MAARKSALDSTRARAVAKSLEQLLKEPSFEVLDKDLSFIDKYARYAPNAQADECARYEATLLRVQRRLSALEPASKNWDGADIEAVELIKIVNAGNFSLDKKIELIAARLRKIAQGPRKWGLLR